MSILPTLPPPTFTLFVSATHSGSLRSSRIPLVIRLEPFGRRKLSTWSANLSYKVSFKPEAPETRLPYSHLLFKSGFVVIARFSRVKLILYIRLLLYP